MTLEEFKELNQKYRMICDWDEFLEICDKDSVSIPCYNNRGLIFWKDEKYLGIITFVSPNSVLDDLEKDGLSNGIESFGELGNYYITIDTDVADVDKVLKYFKPKEQVQRPIPPHSIRNITTFLRVMQNIDSRYKDILNKFIEERRVD